MLRRILQAYGGTLPNDMPVLFQNTGREMPATLDFVRDCGAAWNVPIHWLEYRFENRKQSVVKVSHNSASRDGEPFEHLFRAKQMLPNPVMRFCTSELKIKTSARWVRENMGWDHWSTAIGLRFDEPGRVLGARKRGATTKDRHHPIMPLFDAKIEEHHVLSFWKEQPFDLRLTGRWEGNCDGCFLKNKGAISRMMRDHPDRMQWWADQEAKMKGKTRNPEMSDFRAGRDNYATMLRVTRDQGVIPFDFEDDLPCTDAGCGI